MKFPSATRWRRSGPVRRTSAAFTLIELLAVITIILILAGLILNIAGNAQYKAAVARANAEIQQMSTAMESYKVDNGTYPRDGSANTYTDKLNAQQNYDSSAAVYTNSSAYLFQQLSGFAALASGSNTMSKTYVTFLPGQLSTTTAAPTATTYIVDPFGFSYGYSTANQLAQDQNNTTAGSANPALSAAGYNPTFDLWSTAGYAASGKPYPTVPGGTTTATYYASLWAKNW